MDTAGVHDNSGYFLIEVTAFPISDLCYSWFYTVVDYIEIGLPAGYLLQWFDGSFFYWL